MQKWFETPVLTSPAKEDLLFCLTTKQLQYSTRNLGGHALEEGSENGKKQILNLNFLSLV